MDAVRRKEMQQYRDQALCIEKQLLCSKRVSADSGLGTVTNCDVTTGICPRNDLIAVANDTLDLTDVSSDGESECGEALVRNEKDLPTILNAEFASKSCSPISNQLVIDLHTADCGKELLSDTSRASEITLTSSAHTPDKKNDNQLDETFSSVAMSTSVDLYHYADVSFTSSATSLLAGDQQESILPVSELLPLSVSDLKLQHKSLISSGNSDVATEESKCRTEQCGGEKRVSVVSTEIARPRLVRSNSYTLEAPSPVLLAHVEQSRRNCLSRDSLLQYERSWSEPPEKEVANKSVFAVPQRARNAPAGKRAAVHGKLSTSLPGSASSSPVKVKSASASAECVPHKLLPLSKPRKLAKSSLSTATTPDCESNSSLQSVDSSSLVSHENGMCGVEGNKDIRLLFVELQSEYERERAQLLARQKQEQDEMEIMFRNQCEQLVAIVTSHCPQLVTALRTSAPASPASSQLVKTGIVPQASSTNRELFKYSEAEHKAASVIEAAAQGYLVRRLMRTERVRNVKATILDTVQCALRLEQDCQKEVTPADVELHRGLIIQLNAAIQEFHNVFFCTSVTERMEMIAADRLRVRKQWSRTPAQCAVSTATKKYQQRKSRDGLSEVSSRPSSSRSSVRMCQSSGSSSRGNSVASAPVTRRELRQENRSHHQHKHCNMRKPWR